MTETLCIGIIGLGQIGGSIAKSIKRNSPDTTIYAYDSTESILSLAVSEGFVDFPCLREDARFSQCNYIFLCSSTEENISCLLWLKAILSPDCILTDTSNLKKEIHERVHTLHLESCFIGGHPIITSDEKNEYQNASEYLFENTYYLLTPGEEIDILRLSQMMEFVTSLGAIPIVLTHEEHDYVAAAVEHLPCIIGTAFINTIHKLDTPEETMKLLASENLKDILKRIPNSSKKWEQICTENHSMISKLLDEFIRLIVQIKCWIDNQDSQAIHYLFTVSKEYADSFSQLSPQTPQKIYELSCNIKAKTDELAKITSLLASQDIHLKNIHTFQKSEEEDRVLHMDFYTETEYSNARYLLSAHGYSIF